MPTLERTKTTLIDHLIAEHATTRTRYSAALGAIAGYTLEQREALAVLPADERATRQRLADELKGQVFGEKRIIIRFAQTYGDDYLFYAADRMATLFHAHPTV